MAPSELLPNTANLAFVEELYERYLQDPQSVDDSWRSYFSTWSGNGNGHGQLGPSFRPYSVFNPPAARADGHAAPIEGDADLQDRIVRLVREYRVRGHLAAELDPLGFPRPVQPDLDPSFYGITEADMDKPVRSHAIHVKGPITVRELIESLERTYCRSIGVQYMHIDDVEQKRWLERRMEIDEYHVTFAREEQLMILRKLTEAVTLEEFIQKKYQGAKSFSLEGAESLIPLMTTAIERMVDRGVGELVIGMAHRGRLNVLANILNKSPGQIFHEFDDRTPERLVGRGDVKYHLGHSSEWRTVKGNQAHLTLCFNPSHLEYVNPVALGRTRAKQDRKGDAERKHTACILIHGDAAFAGEGVVQETLNLSELEGYRTGGTLHIVLNNQIGFTTPPRQGRSSTYATDVAKMIQVPIFHVNGENPEAVAQVVKVATEFRATFHKDVVIDMFGYRRWGHNEGDEPAFTQPLMYERVRARASTRDGYLNHLLQLGEVTQEEADKIQEECRNRLEAELARVRHPNYRIRTDSTLQGVWRGYTGGSEDKARDADTTVPAERLEVLMDALAGVPEGFTPHPKIERLLKQRREMGRGKRPFDWGGAELLAMASLAAEGWRVRLTGQDSQRGTFSHRHSVVHDIRTGEEHMALKHLPGSSAPVEIYNSPLSEAGVLGFDYGYSLDWPDALVMWEAQFGDFSNCAQVIMDQFISSAEDKWARNSGLVMLLPHGFEGMGPEHSSARLERYLDLCAEDNMQVAVPTTPAQMFHLLRRQVLRKWRKPLIVFTPKSLLRLKEATSTREELANGRFLRVLADARTPEQAEKTTRILLCSGKVYYELAQERADTNRWDVAIVRMEQLYPFPTEELEEALAPYPKDTPVCWVQEEPENMGAWRTLRAMWGTRILDQFPFFGLSRPESASPATGSKASHDLEQSWLVHKAFEMSLRDASKRQAHPESEITAGFTDVR